MEYDPYNIYGTNSSSIYGSGYSGGSGATVDSKAIGSNTFSDIFKGLTGLATPVAGIVTALKGNNNKTSTKTTGTSAGGFNMTYLVMGGVALLLVLGGAVFFFAGRKGK